MKNLGNSFWRAWASALFVGEISPALSQSKKRPSSTQSVLLRSVMLSQTTRSRCKVRVRVIPIAIGIPGLEKYCWGLWGLCRSAELTAKPSQLWKLPDGVKICTEEGVHDHWNFHEYPLFRAVCYLAGALDLMGMNNAYTIGSKRRQAACADRSTVLLKK